jgi:hypothetical protein
MQKLELYHSFLALERLFKPQIIFFVFSHDSTLLIPNSKTNSRDKHFNFLDDETVATLRITLTTTILVLSVRRSCVIWS